MENQSRSTAEEGALTISHFFYASGTELEKGLEGLFRSLIFQLSVYDDESRSSFHERCCKLFSVEGKKKGGRIDWFRNDLQTVLKNLVLECSARRIVRIFVDAVDECKDQEREELIKYFHDLKGSSRGRLGRPAIFFTCRDYPIGQIEAEFTIQLDHVNQDDIQTYIERELRLPDESETTRSELKDLLHKKAAGLFLWVVLIIPRIHDLSSQGRSMKEIHLQVSTTLQELDGLYDSLLKTIDGKDTLEAGYLFQWVCFAIRPLSVT